MLEKIVLAIVSAVIGGIGVLYLRYLRKDHISEEIKRRSEVVALAEKMRGVGISDDQVVAMLSSMEKDRKAAPALAAPEDDAIERREFAEMNNAPNQQAMNLAAGRRLERLNMRMEHALERVRAQVDGKQLAKLEESQEAWLAFREKIAEFAGEPWGSGSMRPFIVAGAMSRVTKQRIADLESELAQYEGPR